MNKPRIEKVKLWGLTACLNCNTPCVIKGYCPKKPSIVVEGWYNESTPLLKSL